MKISGSGTISAGEYNESISVSGSGKITGNIKCQELSCSGSVKGMGSIRCMGDIRVSGACAFEENVCADNISTSGALKVVGDVSVNKTIKVAGGLRCGGTVRCERLISAGSMDVGTEIAAEEVRAAGHLRCKGLLNAEIVDICLDGGVNSSQVGAIGGSEIKIYYKERKSSGSRRMPLLSKFLGGVGGHLHVDESIEGDVVALEGVYSPKVIGRVVAVGEGCEIGLLQYTEEIELHPNAKVAKCEKI
jgi:cytoskeletal protein CcmA (bactofilin family)